MEENEAYRILSRQELARIAAELREQDKCIVATNGCFDILHVGHIRYLEEARRLGDVLIVGLNSDRSVRALKGESRPVNSELDRAEVLAALRCVDYVTVFDEDTASEFLSVLKPHIYAKGGDYTAAQLPETPTIESYGGMVVILNLVPGKSTTSILSRIQHS